MERPAFNKQLLINSLILSLLLSAANTFAFGCKEKKADFPSEKIPTNNSALSISEKSENQKTVILYSSGITQQNERAQQNESVDQIERTEQSEAAEQNEKAQQNEGTEQNERAQQNERAEQVMKALAAAYPQRIVRAEFRNDDWAVLLRDTWFYYADGRILPEEQLKNAENYSRQPFYVYPKELPEWKKIPDDEAERFRNMIKNRQNNPIRRSSLFFDDLWRSKNRDESYQHVKSIRFLGLSVLVHQLILEELSLVEETIQTKAKTDPMLSAWIKSLKQVDGWEWRNIADNGSRSFHSYGTAVDVIPKSWGGKETYWLWTERNNPEWWNISYNNRYHPPDAVIKAFESYGFIWGGKWMIYDTMHFEYRPEILILNGMSPETRR